MKESPYIKVWRFEDAPAELRDQSAHGGDEDWVALVPAELNGEYIAWLESGGRFGVCDTSVHSQPDGSVLYIGAHS